MQNRIVLAVAGSRKTTSIVEEALARPDEKVLITTYTTENLRQIHEYIYEKNNFIPSNLKVTSWYSFLLAEGVRPYQNFICKGGRISGINFISGRSATYTRKSNIEKYYFSSDRRIYTDKIAEFAFRCNEISKHNVISRLERIYDHIFIDEVQDLAGYDFDFLESLILSDISITVVGDSRQATYFTNMSPKNKKYRGSDINKLFKDWEKKGLVTIQEKNVCYRCNQIICDFADNLYPGTIKTVSRNNVTTGHDGIFKVCGKGLRNYIDTYDPVILRYSKITDTKNLHSINFGLCKGQNYDRVLLFTNNTIKKYLVKRDPTQLTNETKAKLYVALTRARYSVAFFDDGDTCFNKISHCGWCDSK